MCGAITPSTGAPSPRRPSSGPGPAGGTKSASNAAWSASGAAGEAPPARAGGPGGGAGGGAGPAPRRAPRGEALALEEAVRVEGVGDRADLLARDELAVAPHHRGLDVGHRV